ncbi:hypothetical protein KI387_032422, partial [Taxus chinensis]
DFVGVGAKKDYNRSSGGSATGHHGPDISRKTTSFKDILENSSGRSSGKQTTSNLAYLVDLAEDIPSVTIENPEVEEYFKNLSRDAVI